MWSLKIDINNNLIINKCKILRVYDNDTEYYKQLIRHSLWLMDGEIALEDGP